VQEWKEKDHDNKEPNSSSLQPLSVQQGERKRLQQRGNEVIIIMALRCGVVQIKIPQ
jgi:hypothetical protein